MFVVVPFIATLLMLAAGSAYALEPTPSQSTITPPAVSTDTDVPSKTRIIVKYFEAYSARVRNEQAALNAVKVLSETAGVELRHIRLMSGNAQLVEVVGIAGEKDTLAREKIESIVQRIEADPAVEFAEPDAIMRIQ